LRREPKFSIGTWDIETQSIEDLSLRTIGAYDGTDYTEFETVPEFLNFTCQPKYHGTRWFSHNGGKFDDMFLWDWLRQVRPDIDFTFFCAGSCVVSMTLFQGPHYWKFCDSYRLMDAPLHKLTHEWDVQHKKLEFAPDDVDYNRHDCLGLYEVLEKFFGQFDVYAETVASQALKVYRSHFLKDTLHSPPAFVEAAARAAYVGGRCEVYRHDPARLNKYDVNSLYPRAMLDPVPVEYLSASRRLTDRENEIGFYEADISYPDCYLPVLPMMIENRLFFPVGNFHGFFTSLELLEADRAGASIKIRMGYIFRTDRIFAEYVDSLYKMKLQAERDGNAAIRWISKKLLNSLYGKFGQRREQSVYIRDPGTPRIDMSNPRSPIIEPVPGLPGVAMYERLSRSMHILPHIAATVTSRARLLDHKYLSDAGQIWYTDTDSVFTDREIPTGEALGDLKLEGTGDFQAYGLKEYKFDGEMNIKGVSLTVTDPTTGKKTIDRTIGERYIAGDAIHYKRMSGIKEQMRRGRTRLERIDQTKIRRVRIEKRARVGQDTRPWRAYEISQRKPL